MAAKTEQPLHEAAIGTPEADFGWCDVAVAPLPDESMQRIKATVAVFQAFLQRGLGVLDEQRRQHLLAKLQAPNSWNLDRATSARWARAIKCITPFSVAEFNEVADRLVATWARSSNLEKRLTQTFFVYETISDFEREASRKQLSIKRLKKDFLNKGSAPSIAILTRDIAQMKEKHFIRQGVLCSIVLGIPAHLTRFEHTFCGDIFAAAALVQDACKSGQSRRIFLDRFRASLNTINDQQQTDTMTQAHFKARKKSMQVIIVFHKAIFALYRHLMRYPPAGRTL